MSKIMLIIPILLPIIAAMFMTGKKMHERKAREALVMTSVVLTSLSVLYLVIFPPQESLHLLTLFGNLTLNLRVDGLSRIFMAILSILWPLTTLYAFDYMKHEGYENKFYAFFLLSYSMVAGISLAGNLVTMYLFFELLTLATLPLVMHKMDDEARFAGRRYLIYSMSGAAMGFIAVVFISAYSTGSIDFAMGGVLDAAKTAGNENLLRTVFTVAFFGFGVKAALFPMSLWLPSASVAPTPVTALLHAVAVVKAGAFACIRLTYYSFGTEILTDTFAQYIPMCAAIVTIVLGSFLALRTNHLKRRLAWSTVSNLSYILLGITVMTGAGLTAASMHMLYHAFIKITLFFCVGAVLEKCKKEYLDEIEGISKQMPITFACFTVASLALMGIPPLPGFFSKWALGTAASGLGNIFGYLGVAALIISALLTALYLMQIIITAYFPKNNAPKPIAKKAESIMMNIPIATISVCCVLLGVFCYSIQALFTAWLF